MAKLNCWQFKECGRQPGGKNAGELGVCPAAVSEDANGINGGKNGGRACWAIAGTLGRGKVKGGFAGKRPDCFHCSFYIKVLSEEGIHFVPSLEIHEILEGDQNILFSSQPTPPDQNPLDCK